MRPDLASPPCPEAYVDCLLLCVPISVMAVFHGRESKGETDLVFPPLEQDRCPAKPLHTRPSLHGSLPFPRRPRLSSYLTAHMGHSITLTLWAMQRAPSSWSRTTGSGPPARL